MTEENFKLAFEKWARGLEGNPTIISPESLKQYTWNCFRHLMPAEILEGEDWNKRKGLKQGYMLSSIDQYKTIYEILTVSIAVLATAATTGSDKNLAKAVAFIAQFAEERKQSAT